MDYLMNIMLTPLFDVTVAGVFHDAISCVHFYVWHFLCLIHLTVKENSDKWKLLLESYLEMGETADGYEYVIVTCFDR